MKRAAKAERDIPTAAASDASVQSRVGIAMDEGDGAADLLVAQRAEPSGLRGRVRAIQERMA